MAMEAGVEPARGVNSPVRSIWWPARLGVANLPERVAQTESVLRRRVSLSLGDAMTHPEYAAELGPLDAVTAWVGGACPLAGGSAVERVGGGVF